MTTTTASTSETTTNQKTSSTISKSAISFGIAGIDSLIDPYKISYQVEDGSPSVACIVGPDGVGKSILGLSAASVYAASNHANKEMRVIYASTDLNVVQARRSFAHFGLEQPQRRRAILREEIESLSFDDDDIKILIARDSDLADKCSLRWLSPFPYPFSEKPRQGRPQPEPFSQIFLQPSQENESIVNFLDLAEFSAGDDWGLLNRILGLLQSNFDPTVPHLLVIDAVEGLETMAGNVDAFGLRRSRRSRLAQLVRIARKAFCNLLFVIEQKSLDIKLDEVFISDLVLRLNVTEKDGYLQKTIEIEKARSVSHVRGIHELQIRDGRGGHSDGVVPDDPQLLFNSPSHRAEDDTRYLGYMQVWPSLHQKQKDEREKHTQKSSDKEGSLTPRTTSKLFGDDLALLDTMISQSRRSKSDQVEDKVIVSIGEAGTLKSTLAYAFLAEPFRNGNKTNSGAVLISSEGATYEQIESIFRRCNALPPQFSDQVLVRPVKPRFLSSSGFLNRIRFCIRHMKRTLTSHNVSFVPTDIRVVIDNWNTILESHPALASDPLVMQRVFQLLKEEGVLAYIVGTQPGSPNAGNAVRRTHNIGQLEAIHIHTWPVDFFGDRRIAISSSVPGSSDRRTAIYELARDEKSESGVKVLPDFDLYEDLESGKAKRVDLRVKLYSGYHKDDNKRVDFEGSYSDEVSALFGDLFPNSKNGRDVVSFESIERYDAFKEYIQNMGTAKLDETLLFQVDEFWNSDSSARGSLARLTDFLDSKAMDGNAKRTRFIDEVPQGDFKIPLHKDFGMILADREAWRRAKDYNLTEYTFEKSGKEFYPFFSNTNWDYPSIPLTSSLKDEGSGAVDSRFLTVSDVWNALCPKGSELDDSTYPKLHPSWEMFLAACRIVASRSGRLPFDIDMRTSESLSSLVLEIWFSKILDQLYVEAKGGRPYWKGASKKANEPNLRTESKMFAKWFTSQSADAIYTLPSLVKEWNQELDYSLRVLIENLPSRFHEHGLAMSKAEKDAVAFRTWFAPAILCQKENPNLVPLRVPGRFSVRGDWHLGAAKASRSILLAQSAIDKLTSNSMNRKRLRDGVGLPVVEVAELIDTPLNCIRRDGVTERLSYGGLLELEPKETGLGKSKEPSLRRIFRSRIKDYDQDSHEFGLLIRELLRVVSTLEYKWLERSRSPSCGLRLDPQDPNDPQSGPYSLHEESDVKHRYQDFIDRQDNVS